MRAEWAARCVGKMHRYAISQAQLAEKLGLRREYVNAVLNCRVRPAGAEQRFKAALDALIKEGRA